MHEDDSMGVIRLEYSYVFNFEKSYSYVDTQKWLSNNLVYYYGCSILYFIVIVSGKFYMLYKPKYNLKRPFALWCGLNALFYIIGFIRTVPELFFALSHRSLYYSVCIPSNYFQNPVSGFWTWALVLSKIVQLCDTIFIVLQKQQVTFLHVYRHLSIIPYFWFTYIQTTAIMRWINVMEYFLYSYVYSYYALKAMGFKLPKCFTVVIIAMQIVQMGINSIIIIMAYNQRDIYKLDCHIMYQNAIVGFTYYVTNFYFYVKVFSLTYITKKHENKGSKVN